MITKSSGFSLIELLVVVAILGILSTAGILSYNGYIKSTKRNSAENLTQQVALAQSEYYANGSSYYGTTIGDPSVEPTGCTANPTTNSAIESNLFDADSYKVIPEEINFWMCIVSNGASFKISAQEYSNILNTASHTGCRIDLELRGRPERTGC